MSHWAEVKEVDGKLIVQRVVVGDNNDKAGDEGYSWLVRRLGGTWIKTSYNAKTNGFRKNFAGPGYEYREDLDAFVPPKSYPSWVLDTATALWKAPVDMPNDDRHYVWNEEAVSWDLVEEEPQQTP
jgi:hypothetical protein